MKGPLRDRLIRFWETDRGLAALLLSLVALIFVMPGLMVGDTGAHAVGQIVVQVLFIGVFVFGLTVASLSRAAGVVARLVVGVALVCFWTHYFVPGRATGAAKAAMGTATMGLLAMLVLQRVFRSGRITVERVQGAVAAYLLLGLCWANAYELIEYCVPGAFRLPLEPAGRGELAASFGYYSFVTLTTTGYGDIVPVHPTARSAAILEALVGQLFPAVLLARLIAMELAARD